MAWEIYPAKDAFPEFTADWDRLNAKLFASHPYFDSRFVGPLLEHFATGKERLCIHRKDGVITGALILQSQGVGRWASFQPSQAQATPVLLDNIHLLESLFEALPGSVWSIDMLAIDPRYAPSFSQLAHPQIVHPHARTIGIVLGQGFAEYWEKRPKKLAANMKRYLRRAESESGPITLTQMAAPEEMAEGVKRFGTLESAGWKGEAGTAVSADNQQGRFYAEVLKRFAKANQATVYELHIGEQFASSRFVIFNGKMVVFLKTTYDEALSRMAPGRIQLFRVIEDCFGKHTEKTIEFYTNASRDQAEWASFDSSILNIQIFRNNAFATIFALLKAVQQKLKGKNQVIGIGELPPSTDVHSFTSIGQLSDAGYDLHQLVANNRIEESVEWFDLLQRTVYAEDPGVKYYFAAEDHRPALILPLRISSRFGVKSIESLSNYYTSFYCPLFFEENNVFHLRNLLGTAIKDSGGAHVMRFSPMDPVSTVYTGLMSELRALGWIPFRYFCFGNWYLDVNGNWEAYFRSRSANLRNSIKRRNKDFKGAGGTLEVITGGENIDNAINDFIGVYSASWKIPEPYPEFIPSLIRLLANKGMLRLGLARLEGKAIAAQLWYVAGNRACIYKVAYDEAFASFSPGTVLTSHLMQYVIDIDRVLEVDFLIGDDNYKRIWMNNRRERWGIIAYNPRTLVGLVLLIKESVGRWLKPFASAFNSAFSRIRRN